MGIKYKIEVEREFIVSWYILYKKSFWGWKKVDGVSLTLKEAEEKMRKLIQSEKKPTILGKIYYDQEGNRIN